MISQGQTKISQRLDQISSQQSGLAIFGDLTSLRSSLIQQILGDYQTEIQKVSMKLTKGIQYSSECRRITDDLIRFFDECQSRHRNKNSPPILDSIKIDIVKQTKGEIDKYFVAIKNQLTTRAENWASFNFAQDRWSFVNSAQKKFTESVKGVTPVSISQNILLQHQQFGMKCGETANSVGGYFDQCQQPIAKLHLSVTKVFEGFAEKPFLTPRRYRWRNESSESYSVSDRRAQYRYVYVQSQNYGSGRIFSNIAPDWDSRSACHAPNSPDGYVEVGWPYEDRTIGHWW
jgi:hypothetical protein